MIVIELQVWYMLKKSRERKKEIISVPGKGSIVEMKLAVAQFLMPIIKKIEYYYVVVVVEKSDGSPGYRTIVPKTVVSA